MKTIAYSATGVLVKVTCWCSIPFAIPESLYEQTQGPNHTSFFCPVGHSCTYKSNEFDRTKENLAWYESALERTQQELGRTERSRSALKGQLTKTRNKIANGVCPAPGCRRHFDNVQAHIASEHPDLKVIDPETGKQASL